MGKSDHAMVVGDLICEWRANSIFKPSRLYHKADFEEINKLISEVNWEAEFEAKTTAKIGDFQSESGGNNKSVCSLV